MHTRVVRPKHGPELIVRPLRRGDTATVQAVFDRLGETSRLRRFNGHKPRLGEQELRSLASVDAMHHALVAYVDGDPEPVAIARLVRLGDSAEVAFEVADAYQGRGIGSALTQELVSDACAAGIAEVTALVRSDNRAAIRVLSRVLGQLELRLEGPEMLVRAPLPARC
jgi:ribosomal protein S18 acetylase RimI-like enzyme